MRTKPTPEQLSELQQEAEKLMSASEALRVRIAALGWMHESVGNYLHGAEALARLVAAHFEHEADFERRIAKAMAAKPTAGGAA